MDVESIVKEYHSRMTGPEGNMDLVSPWFNRTTCFEDGYLLARCTVAIVGIIGVVLSQFYNSRVTKGLFSLAIKY